MVTLQNIVSSCLPNLTQTFIDSISTSLGNQSTTTIYDLYLATAATATQLTTSRVPPIMSPFYLPILPDTELLRKVTDLYFTESDISHNLLHRGRFTSLRNPPALLVSSILLAGPYIARTSLPEITDDPRVWHAWDRAYFERSKFELMFLVANIHDGSQVVDVETVVALINLTIWAFYKGVLKFGGQLFELSTRLAKLAGIVSDVETLNRATILPLTWEQHATNIFGPSIWTDPNLPHTVVSELRLLWIDFMTRERVNQVLLFFRWGMQDWNRRLDMVKKFDLTALQRQTTPWPKWWDASFDESFDPRMLPKAPIVADIFDFMRYDDPLDPRRLASLAGLGNAILENRMVLRWLDVILRSEVDQFIVNCYTSGVLSPAFLWDIGSTVNQIDSETRARLIAHRTKVDTLLLQVQASFTEPVKKALQESNAVDVFAQFFPHVGCFYTTYTTMSYIPTISMMRLELHSSLGVYLTIPQNGSESLSLADEYGFGGQLFTDFLSDVMLATRFFEDWQRINPTFKHHIMGPITLIFRLCCLHASFYRRFRRSIFGSDPAGLLSGVEHDVQVCLNVLAGYARHANFGRGIYNFAQKIVSDQKMDEVDIDKGWMRLDNIEITSEGTVVVEDTGVEGSVDGGVIAEALQLKKLFEVYQFGQKRGRW